MTSHLFSTAYIFSKGQGQGFSTRFFEFIFSIAWLFSLEFPVSCPYS